MLNTGTHDDDNMLYSKAQEPVVPFAPPDKVMLNFQVTRTNMKRPWLIIYNAMADVNMYKV